MGPLIPVIKLKGTKAVAVCAVQGEWRAEAKAERYKKITQLFTDVIRITFRLEEEKGLPVVSEVLW